MFPMSNLQLICQNCRICAISICYKAAVIAKRGLKLIALTKTLPFLFLTSRNCHSNTVNVLCHVSAGSFPPVREFCNSPQKVYLKYKFDKGMCELNNCKKKKVMEGEISG